MVMTGKQRQALGCILQATAIDRKQIPAVGPRSQDPWLTGRKVLQKNTAFLSDLLATALVLLIGGSSLLVRAALVAMFST